MNCEKKRNDLLLEQSGELPFFRRPALERHLRSCEACRRYREELLRIAAAARSTAPANVREETMERILAAARREHTRSTETRLRPSRQPALVTWRPALVYATIGVMLLLAFLAVVGPLRKAPVTVAERETPAAPEQVAEADEVIGWGDDLDTQIDELDSMITLAAGSSPWSSESVNGGEETEDLDTLARELLALQGEQI